VCDVICAVLLCSVLLRYTGTRTPGTPLGYYCIISIVWYIDTVKTFNSYSNSNSYLAISGLGYRLQLYRSSRPKPGKRIGTIVIVQFILFFKIQYFVKHFILEGRWQIPQKSYLKTARNL
jgi:hypothetical protein